MTLRKIIGTGVAALIMMTIASGALTQQNPFFSNKKNDPPSQSRRMAPPHPLLIKLATWQKQLSDTMAVLMDKAHREKRPGPMIYLLLIAFVYGMLHAAGPGHGKAVATSFMVSQEASLGRGLLLGNGVALAHGFSGILLMLSVHFIINSGVVGPLQSTTKITQYISYSLITLLGTFLVIKNLVDLLKTEKRLASPGDTADHQTGIPMLPVAIAVGIVPCPGVVMVMILAMSMNMIALGVALGVCIALGMAVTITVIVILCMYAKTLALRIVSGRRSVWSLRLATGIKLLAGCMMAALGGLMLIGVLYN